MKRTGAEILIKTLLEQGVDTVFGYPGGAVLNIYDEIYKYSDQLTHIITSHEQGACHAADGYARLSGKVGVVIATSGPGATNLVTGIATAYLDSTPLVAITGNVATSLLGKDSFQEVDISGITLPVTKHNYIVKDVTKLAGIVRQAFQIAKSGRPGPVLIDIPKDIQAAECEYTPGEILPKFSPPAPDPEDFQKAVDLINASEKPFVYCGGGVVLSDSSESLLKLAEAIDAPVGTSMMGLSAVPRSFPGFVGMTGMHGRYAATKSMYESDLILAIGVRFSDRATGNISKFAPNAKILHIDVDQAEINKNIPTYHHLLGDIGEILPELLKRLTPQKRPQWHDEVVANKKFEADSIVRQEGLTPKKAIEEIRKYTQDDTPVATDVGQHQMWTTQFYDFEQPRRFLTSGGLGTMGFGLGAAIGGCIASGKKDTVLITGDGSFHMNLNELATAVSNGLPIKVFVMDNNVLGMVRQWQTMFYQKHYSCTTLDKKTDFVLLAQAFGGTGIRIRNLDELEDGVKKAFKTPGMVVVDLKIDSDEMVLPMIPPNGSISDIVLNEKERSHTA